MRIHNTFHVSLLTPCEDNKFPSQIPTPPPPFEIDGEPEYQLEEIIDSRLYRNELQYQAKWTGYSHEYDKTWYPAENFNNASLATEQFHSRYPRNQDWVYVTISRSASEPRPTKGEKTPTQLPATVQEG